MIVYDFDGTLRVGDSTADFFKWCARRHPRVLRTVPRTALAALGCYGLRAIDKTGFKQALYRFLPLIPDIEAEVDRFWRANEHLIGGPCNPREGDLVISAGPEFLLRDVCARRGLELIASQVDPHTGRVLGPNCSGEEKVRRFREAHPGAVVEEFYSDSHNDDPMARLAGRAFLVRIPEGSLTAWHFTE
ncbi:MAG: phosphoserine phosphatase [Coriobacteriaceae bacterium]|nr:phosphoserine phosphatase [Coriobacteriaceae bacterium]